ncbi:hypothetical protein DFH28DRAFT_887423 [Melampsora americana]|nr:hypothetical protein DFH28DRAFT_887423 [Melampsora americana]
MSNRRKPANSKDNEAGSVINMLTSQNHEPTSNVQSDAGKQGDSNKASNEPSLQSQGLTTNQPIQTDQGNSVKTKSSAERINDFTGETINKDGGQGKDLVNPDYLAILGDKPSAMKKGVTISINDEAGDLDSNIDMSDKNEIFAKAMELSSMGNAKQALMYLKIYENLMLPSERPANKRSTSDVTPNVDNSQPAPIQRSMSAISKDMPEGAVFKNGMWFFPGKTSNYNNRSYTPYFDRNIQELRYPIPLTIFDKDWQSRAMTSHAKKRSRSNDGDSKSEYGGLPYADEWLLDYGEWSLYYDTFVSVLSTKFTKFTEWAKAHKENVSKVLALMGWMTALKYDMRVRENALVNRVEIDGKVAPPDISEYDQVLAEECWSESRMRDELNFKKNPYVEGGERESWDAATGKPPKRTFNKFVNNKNKPYKKWNNNQKEETMIPSGSSTQQREKKKFRKGYQGNNYDENYAEKKAIAAAAAKESPVNK